MVIPDEQLLDRVDNLREVIVSFEESPMSWAVENLLEDFIKWKLSSNRKAELQSQETRETENKDITMDKLEIDYVMELALERLDLALRESEENESNPQ